MAETQPFWGRGCRAT